MIAFTSDIDWAPEQAIQEMLDIFEFYKVPCTLFCTHESEVINKCSKGLFEIAIHPNFNGLLFTGQNANADEIVEDLLTLYPSAIGVRSHSMTQSSRLLNLFKAKGLAYDSNQFLPYNFKIAPYKCWTGLTRIPYNWEDDIHFAYGYPFDGHIFSNGVENKPYVLMDFHPIHVFLNTESEERYLNARAHYNDARELRHYENKKSPGSRDFLINTLEFMRSSGVQGRKLSDLIL